MQDSTPVNCNANSALLEPSFLAVNLVWCSGSLLSFVMCIVATLLSVNRFCWKAKTVSTERTEKLLLYLVIFSMAYSFVNCFQWLRLLVQYGKPETNVGCAIVGFGIQYLGTGILVIMFCIGIHLLLLICHPKCLNSTTEEEKLKRYRILELGYIISAIAVPVLLVPWPWINYRYGPAGYWCWIEAWDESCNRVIDGFIEQILLWYLWVFLLMAFTTVVTAITLGLMYYYRKKRIELDPKEGYIDIKIYTLLSYLVVCLVVNVIGLTNRSIQWDKGRSPYPLLILHAMAYPLWGILSAIVVYVVVYFNWKKEKQHHRYKANKLQKETATVRPSVAFEEDSEFATEYMVREESSVDNEVLKTYPPQ